MPASLSWPSITAVLGRAGGSRARSSASRSSSPTGRPRSRSPRPCQESNRPGSRSGASPPPAVTWQMIAAEFAREEAGPSVAGCDCGFDVIEDRLKYQVMKRLDPLRPDRLVLPDRVALDRVAKNRRAFGELQLEPVLALQLI